MSNDETKPAPAWMKYVLRAAAIYNLLWGTCAILFPAWLMQVSGYPEPAIYPQLWQGIGMLVGVYGVAYWITATDPYRHWPIVLVGLMGKVFGPLGLLGAIVQGELPPAVALTMLPNDLIWWAPFMIILWKAIEHEQNWAARETPALDWEQALQTVKSQSGKTLTELSEQQSVLVLFVRHAGCTFCREALADLEQQRQKIEVAGHQIAIVHMGSDESALDFFKKYNLEDVPRFSDPEQLLYRAFDLELGKPSQLFGLKIWWKGFKAAILNGHGFGGLQGNGFRMPGMFIIQQGQIVSAHRHKDASERPDYAAFACELPTQAT